ncbi:hypothetical protein [Gleimia coleocanis]|nr:hypothetical protein [Gleimia coleocanis]
MPKKSAVSYPQPAFSGDNLMFLRISRSFPAFLAGTAVSLSLAGCSVHWDYGHPILPETAPETLVLQDIIFDDQRFTTSATEVTQSGSCPECNKWLTAYTSTSEARIKTLGGAWNPWPNGVPADAEDPANKLPKPSVEPATLAEEMVMDALADFHALGNVTDENVRLLGTSTVLEKFRTGVHLAQAAGSLDKLMAVLNKSELAVSTAQDFPEGDEPSANMVTDWDCAVQILPVLETQMSAADSDVYAPLIRQMVLGLEKDAITAWSAGVADHRTGSCLGAFEVAATGSTPSVALHKINDQLLLSTALAYVSQPTAGLSVSAEIPQTGLAFSALFKLSIANEFVGASPLPGVVTVPAE